jgi:hypothetical protein
VGHASQAPKSTNIFGVSQVTETDHELAKEVTKKPQKKAIFFFFFRDASVLDLSRRSHD